MTGYRENSSYDPNAFEQPGPPLKPYNWVQWTGVAIGSVGLVLVLLDSLGRLGWIPRWVEAPPTTFVLMLVGVMLINSRRAPPTQAGSEQLAKNRKTLILTAVVVALILGAAAFIELQGA